MVSSPGCFKPANALPSQTNSSESLHPLEKRHPRSIFQCHSLADLPGPSPSGFHLSNTPSSRTKQLGDGHGAVGGLRALCELLPPLIAGFLFLKRLMAKLTPSHGRTGSFLVLPDAVACLRLPEPPGYYFHSGDERRAYLHKLHSEIVRLSPPVVPDLSGGRDKFFWIEVVWNGT
jgi:hypothetical protein